MKQSMARTKGQVYSVGNYLMTGKVLGKGHFARVEEATHRIIGKKVAIKIIDLTCIKEEYARRNLHREPRVMARLRHPCIAALYETMMHGPRLYVVMEAAGGGDLCTHVLSSRGPGGLRGLPETRARHLSVQLVSAVKHMHARGVVHRDLKMENIMLDTTKQFIKIVDFGLSNVWSGGGGLRTPCGSLEYAAPELFLDGRRYGPEVDLWSVGVIVYGMVTGSLPFGGAAGSGAAGGNCAGGEGSGRSRPQLRAAIARGFSRKHRAALGQLSAECKLFVQQLLEPVVENRMRVEEASRHRWLRKPGLRLHAHPLPDLELKNTRLIARQISELSGQSLTDVAAEMKADPYGSVGGMYNIKSHVSQLQGYGTDMLWTNNPDQPRPVSPPIYQPQPIFKHSVAQTNLLRQPSPTTISNQPYNQIQPDIYKPNASSPFKLNLQNTPKPQHTQNNLTIYKAPQATVCKPNGQAERACFKPANTKQSIATNTGYKSAPSTPQNEYKAASSSQPLSSYKQASEYHTSYKSLPASPAYNVQSPSSFRAVTSKVRGLTLGVRKPMFKVQDSGDCVEPRLPIIDEHGKLDSAKGHLRPPDDRLRLHASDRSERPRDFYRRAGDALPSSWRATGVTNTSARILLQSNATTIKRASLGNIVSPHSSTNSQCKSERSVPVSWYARNSTKETSTPLRLRRTAPIK